MIIVLRSGGGYEATGVAVGAGSGCREDPAAAEVLGRWEDVGFKGWAVQEEVKGQGRK